MTIRTSVACVIRVHDYYDDDSEVDWFVGPFMPHVGSAVDRAYFDLEHDDERPDRLVLRQLYVETLFLAEGESDLAIAPRDRVTW